MTKTTWYFSELGSSVKRSSVWVKKSNQLSWIKQATSNYFTCFCAVSPAKGRPAQPYLRRAGRPACAACQPPASALSRDELRSTEKDERVLAQLFQVSSKKRGFYRKNKSLNQKQHGKVAASVGTGDPWSKELTDLLHWEKLQPPRTSFCLQGKDEHEVPLTDKNLAQHEYARSIAPGKKSGQRRLVFSVSGWIFCLFGGFGFLFFRLSQR